MSGSRHPTRAGPYELVQMLGRGGMGSVYRARRADLDREVALKLIQERHMGNRSARGRFQREARAMTLVSHPNVVRLLDADLEADPPYMAMELIEGPSLESKLGPGEEPWDRAKVLALGRDVAAGLEALHEAGIVHRDLKPANVLFDPASRSFMLTDFGLAGGQQFTRMTKAGDIVGTPAYLSPEGWRGEPLGPRSDVFQLGVLLYQAWTARSPYGYDLESISSQIERDPEGADALRDDPLGVFLLRCLAFDPSARPADGAAARAALEALTRGEALPPVRAREPAGGDARRGEGRAARGAPPPRRGRGTVALAGLAFLGLAIASALVPSQADPTGTAPESSTLDLGARRALLRWTTRRATPTRVEVVTGGETETGSTRWILHAEGEPTTDHRIHVPLSPGEVTRVAILDGADRPGTPERLTLPADPLLPRDLALTQAPSGRPRLEFRVEVPAGAVLRAGDRAVARSPEATRVHALLVPASAVESPTPLALELTSTDRVVREVPLPGGIPHPLTQLGARAAALGRRAVALLAEHTPESSALSTRERSGFVRHLAAEGLLAEMDALRPELRAAFRDRGVAVERKLRLYEDLATLDWLDHLGGAARRIEPLFEVAPLYRPLIAPGPLPPDAAELEEVTTPFDGRWGFLMSLSPPPEGTPGRTHWNIGLATWAGLRAEFRARLGPLAPAPRRAVSALIPASKAAGRRRLLGLEMDGVLPGLPLVAEVEGRVRLRMAGGFMLGEVPPRPEALGPCWSLAPEVLGPGAWRVTFRTARFPGSETLSVWLLRGVLVAHGGAP